ncbi:uncharacterized protein LOC134180673 [Corticium candelabrum]|uniref:uncharacterized protein LOC134180673 n=1 Tax=Corticium candelabrum TaxID=121492 RepID=UPI002E2750C6|nr:uncharacterized protein LOC134180673 [Corticium candelabrum]
MASTPTRRSYLPGEKFTISELLQSYNLPADVEIIESLLGETKEESLVPGQKIRFHFLVEEEVIGAVREDTKSEIKIPLNCSLDFELLPDNSWLDDQRYPTVRHAYTANPQPVSVFATCCLLLPDGYQVDEGDEVELTSFDEDPTYGSVVCGIRKYFSHQLQQIAIEHYRFPIDLEANFSTSAPVRERYLAVEILHQLSLPRRVRMHHRREPVDKFTGMRPPPRPAIKMQLQKLEKRYFVIANDIKTGRVFAVPVNNKQPVHFAVKSDDTRPNTVDDHAHLLYGLVDFWSLPRIGKDEESAMLYEDPLPVVKVPPRPEVMYERLQSIKLSYQLIPTHEYDRIAVVFAPKDKLMQSPSSNSTSLGEVHFYEAFRSSTNEDALVVKQCEPPLAKRNINLENAALEYQLDQLKRQVPQSVLDQLGKKSRKDSPPPPVLPRRATMVEVPMRKPLLIPRSSGSPPANAKHIIGFMKGIQHKILGKRSKAKPPSPVANPSPPPIQPKGERSPMPPPVTAKPKPQVHPKPKPRYTEKQTSVSDDGAYVQMERGRDQLSELRDELEAEEKRNRELKQQLAKLETEYEDDRKKLQVLQRRRKVYDDENPQRTIMSFSTDEVVHLLKGLKLEQYEQKFREFEVEGYWLVDCDREALNDMGVRAMHARRIECAVKDGNFPSGAKLSAIMSSQTS